MSAEIIRSIALSYGGGKITQAGLDFAYKKLGIDEQQGNPKYAISLGGINLNPMNMIKRAGINKTLQSIIGSGGGSSGILSTLGPLALGAGAIYFLNKNREKLTGYKTQQAYEDARNQRRANKRLDYITDRMTSGKKYGNYEDSLLDSGAGAVKIDDVITFGSDNFPESLTPKKPYTQPYNIAQVSGNGGGGEGGGGGYATDDTASFFSKGGIASL